MKKGPHRVKPPSLEIVGHETNASTVIPYSEEEGVSQIDELNYEDAVDGVSQLDAEYGIKYGISQTDEPGHGDADGVSQLDGDGEYGIEYGISQIDEPDYEGAVDDEDRAILGKLKKKTCTNNCSCMPRHSS